MANAKKGQAAPQKENKVIKGAVPNFKGGSSFKIGKGVKCVMANIMDPHARGLYKRCMIEAKKASQRKTFFRDEPATIAD